MKAYLTPLHRLDKLLEKAVTIAQEAYGTRVAADPFRGLYINTDEVSRLLDREPGAPLLWSMDDGIDASGQQSYLTGSHLVWLKDAFGLSEFDLDVIIIALAPELDLRYERLYAYLQDNVARRKATVELVLNLLCSSTEEKIERRTHFAPDAPLVRRNLIHLIEEPNHNQTSLLSHSIILDEQITNLLLYQKGLDSRLSPFCELIYPSFGMDCVPLAAESRRALLFLTNNALQKRQQLHLYFHGPRGVGKKMTTAALAFEMGKSVLVADLSAIYNEPGFVNLLKILFREALFKDALLCLDEIDTLIIDENTLLCRQMLKALADSTGITVLIGMKPWTQQGFGPKGVLPIPFTVSNYGSQRRYWNESLTAENITLDESELDSLASRFRLTRHQILSAVDSAKNLAHWNTAVAVLNDSEEVIHHKPNLKDIFNAARAQSGSELGSLAQKIDVRYNWKDIVLPEEAITQLNEMCQRIIYRHRVLGEWGFDSKLSLGKGVNALFSGPSGTGKTMAAEIIANELGLDLYKIDLSGVVSKYIGETEKNLDRIFTAAESANAILFFDEADALFGKRFEVRDAHDRYANIEVSYLLQKMEQYEGITILTTNLRQNLDDAFMRRMAYVVHFPFPDQESRLRIWYSIWPKAAPLAADVEHEFLARQFKLSGGNIKNIALTASFLAAAEGGEIMMKHLFHATKHEYQKMGKTLSEPELFGEKILR